jgi:hypothetical protein
MLTQDQETFLAKFADTELDKIKAEQTRIAEAEAIREKELAKEEYIAQLQAEKEKEIADAILAYDIKPIK